MCICCVLLLVQSSVKIQQQRLIFGCSCFSSHSYHFYFLSFLFFPYSFLLLQNSLLSFLQKFSLPAHSPMLLDISLGSDLLLLICHSAGREPKATLLPPALTSFSRIFTDPQSTAISADQEPGGNM